MLSGETGDEWNAGEDAVLVGFAQSAVAGVEGMPRAAGACSADSTRMEGGEERLSARSRLAGGMGAARRKLATWPRAWTPASVRPEPCGRTSSPVIRLRAAASVPWTVGSLGCTCQPR